MANHWHRWLLDPIPVLLSIGVLLGANWLGLELRRNAVSVSFADRTVVPAAAVPVILGRIELGQHTGPRSASQRHLHVDRRGDQWMIANASDDRRIFARTRSGAGFYLKRWPLESGDQIVLSTATLEVVEASERLELRDLDNGRSVSFDGGILDLGGETVYPICHSPIARFTRDLRWRMRRGLDAEIRLFSIGGGVNCTSRWSLPELKSKSIHIRWHRGTYQVAPGTSHNVFFVRAGVRRSFSSVAVRVDAEDPIVRLILGRTVYEIATDRDKLSIEPVANRDLWREEAPELPMIEAAWSGSGLEVGPWLTAQFPWLLTGVGVALVVTVLIRFLLANQYDVRGASSTAIAPAIAISAIGAWVTVLALMGEVVDASIRYGLVIAALCYASMVFFARGRLFGIGGILWVTAMGLVLIGTLVLFTLGAGAENTQWMRFFDKHSLLVALFGWTIGALGTLSNRNLRQGWIRLFNTEWIVAAAGVFLVIAMAAQFVIGDETGIAGLQPVELTKFVYVVLLSFAGMHLTELRRRDTREFQRSPLSVLLPFLRMIGGFGLVVLSVTVGVRDFSTAIILGLVTLMWLYRVGRRERSHRAGVWTLLRPAVALSLASIVAIVGWARANPESLPAGMPQRDRILVWSQPELHPHSGSQVLAAMDRVGEGGWLGARAWFGPNEEVMKVPAVQDDFITAFLLNRFGGLAGLALMGLQLLYLVLLFSLARRIETATTGGDFREQNAGRTAGFALFGLAWMHAIHWAIAWCNVLGLLPVMGQPMTWLSAGNSHLLGFSLLSLTVALATSWVFRNLSTEHG